MRPVFGPCPCLVDNTVVREANAAEIASIPGDTGIAGRAAMRRLHEKRVSLARERDARATKTPGAQPNANP